MSRARALHGLGGRLAGLSLLCLAVVSPGTAAVPGVGIGQVNGTVFDTARKGVPGLSVAVIPEDGRALYGTSTDADGRYGVRGMPPGLYSVIVAVPGGAVRKDAIRIRPLFRSIVDFNLSPQPTAVNLPGLNAGPAATPGRPAAPPGVSPPSPAGIPGPWGDLGQDSGGAGSGTPPPVPAPPADGAAGAPPAPGGADASAGPATGAVDPPEGSAPPAPAVDGHAEEGMAITWILKGPEQISAPDAWVAAIPAGGEGHLRRDRTRPDGGTRLEGVAPGNYSLLVKAAGFMTWRMGPLPLNGDGELSVTMSLIPYPMGFKGTIEDVLIPFDPIPLDLK